jgi:hypothetical protein
MIITGDDSEYIAFIKAYLREQFLMTDLGPLCYFLGIEVSSTFGWLLYLSGKVYPGSSCSCCLMTHKYRGSQQSSREVKPKFIDLTQGEPKNIYMP